MMDLHRGSYTGQFGFFMIDSANDPGRYDQEVFLALREWQYFLSTVDQDEMAPDPNDPRPERTAPDRRPNGLEVSAPLYSINDKMLGAGEPLRVQSGQLHRPARFFHDRSREHPWTLRPGGLSYVPTMGTLTHDDG